MAEKEEALERLQNNIHSQVQRLVAHRISKREETLKHELNKLLLKYQESVNEMNKENKRLQSSLKDVVSKIYIKT